MPLRLLSVSTLAGRLILLITYGLFAFILCDAQEATAQPNPRRVEFTLSVGSRGAEEVETTAESSSTTPDRETAQIRAQRDRETAQIAAQRIKTRLDAIDIKNHRVQVDTRNRIQVTVYGRDLSATAIKSSVIPHGALEIRAVIDDSTPWTDLISELPDGVELQAEPGALQTDRVFLYSEDINTLRSLIARISLSQAEIDIFPHRGGWRTVVMGPPLGTHHDLVQTKLSRTPSAIPFITAQLTPDATSRIRTAATEANARHLAVLLDDELVAMPRFSERQFEDELTLDCPDFLRSTESRLHWAMQIAGRLATPIPITLIESKEQ